MLSERPVGTAPAVPGQVMAGATVSVTVTLIVQFVLSPALSVALHETLVVPRGNSEPVGVLQTIEAIPEASVAVGAMVTLANGMPDDGEAVSVAGHVMAGAIVSVTVIVKRHWLVLPALSTATHVTTLAPSGYKMPELLLHVVELMPLLSEDTGRANVTLADARPPWVGADMLAGHVIVGWVESTTRIPKMQLAVNPA